LHAGIMMVIMFIGVGFLVITALILVGIISRLGRGRSGGAQDEEEARMMQEIHRGLEEMEKRVEALETILLERERKDES